MPLLMMAIFASFGMVKSATAAELAGVKMADEIQVNGTRLMLNGLGLREATVFQVDVYVAGLYLESRNQDENHIIRSPNQKVIRTQFVRSIGAAKLRESFIKSIQRSCTQQCAALTQLVQDLGKSLPDIRSGDVMTYIFGDEEVRITLNGVEKGVIRGAENARVVMASFIGPKPPDPEMKAGMLGLSP